MCRTVEIHESRESAVGAQYLNAFRVHRRSQQRQIIFPTDHRAEFAERRVEHRKRRAIAKTPTRRSDAVGITAMLAEIASIGCEERTQQ
jgi:hypothetical protein